MKLNQLVFPALALALATCPLLMAAHSQPQGHPQPEYGQDHHDQDRGGWDAPPQEFRDVQRQGFHDGLEAGRHDFESHRQPSAERRREFRHPPVPPPVREEYREGFRRGYDSAFGHFRDDHHGDDHHGDDHDRR
jgi:hypothetical protein